MADETQTPATETPAPPARPAMPETPPAGSEAGGGAPALDIGGGAATQTEPAPEPQPAKFGWWWGTGRRKNAVARVRIRPGNGEYRVYQNGKKFKPVSEYFTEERDRNDVLAPLRETGTDGKVDVYLRVRGGGFTGQAGAVVLGVARALKAYDPTLEGVLRDKGFLTRDAREVERKKYGQPGARRQFQFSKR